MTFQKNIDELQQKAVMWWPQQLREKDALANIIPMLIKTQDDFLSILSLAKESPFHVYDLLVASRFPANLFLKHLSVLADYGGEPMQRLGRSFDDLFLQQSGDYEMYFSWKGEKYTYSFESLPIKGLGNKKLKIDGQGLQEEVFELSSLYKDVIAIFLFGASSNVGEMAGLSSCEIGSLLGKKEVLHRYVKQRYILVSRITGGATANSLGQLAQKEVYEYLRDKLPNEFVVVSNGSVHLDSYAKDTGLPFDITVEKNGLKVGIEVSFQVTTNSTIERKAGQAAERLIMMNNEGHHVAYVIDGAGNFQRRSAVSTICGNSECTVAFCEEEFSVLVSWIKGLYV